MTNVSRGSSADACSLARAPFEARRSVADALGAPTSVLVELPTAANVAMRDSARHHAIHQRIVRHGKPTTQHDGHRYLQSGDGRQFGNPRVGRRRTRPLSDALARTSPGHWKKAAPGGINVVRSTAYAHRNGAAVRRSVSPAPRVPAPSRDVPADFDGGRLTDSGGGLPLREVGLAPCAARCGCGCSGLPPGSACRRVACGCRSRTRASRRLSPGAGELAARAAATLPRVAAPAPVPSLSHESAARRGVRPPARRPGSRRERRATPEKREGRVTRRPSGLREAIPPRIRADRHAGRRALAFSNQSARYAG